MTKHPRTTTAHGGCEHDALRCDCGSLLARYVDGKVELKCRRCKRTVLLPIDVTAAARPHGTD